MTTENEGSQSAMLSGTCFMAFKFESTDPCKFNKGFCWGSLFSNAILVRGYPICQRNERSSGLEMSLGIMACLIRTNQVIQLGEMVLMKGFNMLLVATLASAGIVAWHLITSERPDERISYSDPRIQEVAIGSRGKLSLRALEESRHIIGWCASATDFCGMFKSYLFPMKRIEHH